MNLKSPGWAQGKKVSLLKIPSSLLTSTVIISQELLSSGETGQKGTMETQTDTMQTQKTGSFHQLCTSVPET